MNISAKFGSMDVEDMTGRWDDQVDGHNLVDIEPKRDLFLADNFLKHREYT